VQEVTTHSENRVCRFVCLPETTQQIQIKFGIGGFKLKVAGRN